jgi:hypothetical protein
VSDHQFAEKSATDFPSAAVLVNLDLFITSDTAVAHLAGALGVPVWMPLSTTPDGRWMTHREDNPWYPTMRIFRQAEHICGGLVFQRMATELAARVRTPSVTAGIAPGELIDQITILPIKTERLQEPAQREHVGAELAALTAARDRTIFDREGVAELTAELRAVKEALWSIEDRLRECERAGDFGPEFIELARSVSKTNDHRAALKQRINERLRSELIEEKSHGTGAAADLPETEPAA